MSILWSNLAFIFIYILCQSHIMDGLENNVHNFGVYIEYVIKIFTFINFKEVKKEHISFEI